MVAFSRSLGPIDLSIATLLERVMGVDGLVEKLRPLVDDVTHLEHQTPESRCIRIDILLPLNSGADIPHGVPTAAAHHVGSMTQMPGTVLARLWSHGNQRIELAVGIEVGKEAGFYHLFHAPAVSLADLVDGHRS